MDQLVTRYPWSYWGHQLQDLGSSQMQQATERAQHGDKYQHRTVYRTTEFPVWMQKLPLEPQVMMIFTIPSGWCGTIHQDANDRHCALNIPLQHCEAGTMDWFSHTGLTWTLDIASSGTPLKVARTCPAGEAPVPMYRTVINQPSLLNVDIPHRIDNRDNPHDRWMLSFRFKNNPSYWEAMNKLRPVLEPSALHS